jgi:hypothetical protein
MVTAGGVDRSLLKKPTPRRVIDVEAKLLS